VFKKEDKTFMTNCRHISLLTVFSIVFEKAAHSILSRHLPTNTIQVSEQHDFRKGMPDKNNAFRLRDVDQKMHEI
jgi:hypothetical protein